MMKAKSLAAYFLICILELQPLMANAVPSYKDGTCSKQSGPVCIDATPCKTMQNGITTCLAGVPLPDVPGGADSVSSTCWEYQYVYTCLDEASFDDCENYKKRGCGQIGSQCSYRTPNGACTVFDQTYQCQLTQPTTTTTQDCSTATICSNGNCWATPQTNYSQDFGSAMAGMEIARQASVYKNCDSNGNCTFFKGVGSQCNEGYFGTGMGNCCMTSGVQANDHSVLQSTGMNLAISAGVAGTQAAGNAVAQWTYSSLYTNDPSMLIDLVNSSSTAAGLGYDAAQGSLFGGATFGAFGFSVGTASAGAGGLTGGAGTMVLYDFSTGAAVAGEAVAGYGAAGATTAGNSVLMFNPYVFAAIVAYMVITEMMKCSEEEQILSLKRGTNLCVQTDRWCTQKIPLVGCVRHAQSYCCYNSLLAKAINVGGRAQVGRPVGGGQGSPDCSGLTLTEMQSIDFSRIDFSEFIASVTQGAYGTAMTAAQSSEVNTSLQNKLMNRCANGANPDSTGHCPTTQ